MRSPIERHCCAVAGTFALAAVLLAGCTGTVGTSPTAGPTPKTTPSNPAMPALTVAFGSPRLGYAIKHPADWVVTAATRPWLLGTEEASPAVDLFQSRGPNAFVVSSQPLPNGTSDDAWFAGYLAGSPPHPECFPPRPRWESITIAGQPAGVHGGLAMCNYTEAVAIVGRRAYVFTGYADVNAPTGGIFDRALFDAFMASVTFQPDRADDTPVP